MNALRDEIYKLFVPSPGKEEEVILHIRQRDALADILRAVRKASELLGEGHPEEVIAEEIRAVVPVIGRMTGEIRAEEVMDDIFDRFCVGK